MGDTSGHRFLGKISLGWLWSRITTLLEDKSDKKNQFIANGSSTLPTKTIQIDTPSGPSSATFIMDTAVDNAFGAANEDSAIPTCSNVVNYVAGAIQTAQVGATTFHGTLTSPSQLSSLTSYKAGWYWAVGTAGTYAGKVCEAGDFVFCISDYSLLYNENDFSVVQNNIDLANFTAKRTASIPFGKVDSTSTATVFTATVAGITKLEDGVCCYLTNDVVTSASGFTLNINGLGAKPVYTNLADATRDTTIFNKAYTMLFVYNSTRVSGGCWDCYRGYDSNTNTIGYQLRTNNGILKTTDAFRYYKVLFTSADNTHWIPSSVDSTNNATSAKAVNQRPINPFGPIVYCHSTSAFAANADVTATAIWQQYAITLGYSFNRTGAALALTTKSPVYIKCTPQSDGSAIIDADTPYVQTLPTTEDGKIYIYFGIAYSATAVELRMEHPVFYYKGGAIRVWVNQAKAVGKVELEKYNSDATESSEGTPANGQTDVKVDNVSIGTVVTSYAPGTAQRPYVAPSWYALNTKLSGKQDTISDLNEIRSGASKGSTAIQPTDIRDELDPGGNGEIPDSAAIAEYIENAISDKVENVELRRGDTYDLPYDAQVEYLQSSGTQYIDTGILATQDLECEIDCSINNGTSDVTILGARSGNTRMYLVHRASSSFCIGYGNYYTGGTFANNTRYFIRTILQPNSQTMDVDGTNVISQTRAANSTDINLYLYALNYSSKFYSNAKIWSCKIKQDGTLVRDFIPVRVGQVGYMYDKISGQLFGNEGTGDFTFGNDVEDDLEQTDLYVDDEKVGTLITSYAPSASARPYVAPSWQSLDERLSTKSDKSNTYTKSEVNGLVSGINNNVIIGELPTTGQLQNRIYRVPGTNSYTDWAWDGSDWVKLAEFSGSIFMQITEAEYDALSDSEKNNGTWYFIEEE